jgi:hypothetical protein
MLSRSQRRLRVFKRPFALPGIAAPLPAGTYAVDTEEELVQGLSFPAYRCIGTTITRVGGPADAEAITVDAKALAAAEAADPA